MQNGGKRARHSIDQWDRQSTLPRTRVQDDGIDTKKASTNAVYDIVNPRCVEPSRVYFSEADCAIVVMERDMRLTGFLRGQTDRVKAPAGFELSNPWKV